LIFAVNAFRVPVNYKYRDMPQLNTNFSVLNSQLGRLRLLFNQAVAVLAKQCTVNEKLNSQQLDEHQIASFEIAWAGAELLAAETYVKIPEGSDNLDKQLAALFAIDAITAILPRLEVVYLELGLALEALQQFSSNPNLIELRKNITNSAALSTIGQSVIQVGGNVDFITLEGNEGMAQASFRRFGDEVVTPLAQSIHREDLLVPETILQPLRDMGVFGLSIPENYGGSAPEGSDNALMMIAVTEALSEASLAAAGSLITRPEILSRALLAGGTEAQKQFWLPKIAQGNPLCAISITEPDYGSDVASLTLKATRTKNGWLLNGAKTWCTFAGKAGLVMVVARTGDDKAEGHRGLSLMLVEKPSFDGHEFVYENPNGGQLTGRAIATIGYRGMHSFDLAFENFFVPDACVIGEEAGLGRGFYFTMSGMVGGRIQTAARAAGVMTAALKASVKYATDRRVFGSALGDFSLTQMKIARMAARLAGCRQLTYAIAKRLETESGRMEASLAKLFACRSAELITREALQIHGGMGYAEEMPVSRYFVDARVLSIFEGAEETLALKVVARGLLEASLGSH
jgi:(2S)-methylsuccinyl-CoA dehydrogenase